MYRIFTIAATALLLSACSYLHPYRPNIQQGNIIKASQVAKLRKGMSYADVVRTMGGRPLLQNTYANNQVSYVYTYSPNNGPKIHKRVIVTFSRGRVVSINKAL